MTPLDILILALPADRDRAEMVLDGLHEARVAGIHPTRIETADPQVPAWAGVAEQARASRCVLFCWSRATQAPEAAPIDRKSTRLNSSHVRTSRMPSSA